MKDMNEEFNKYKRELENILYTDTKEEISESELKLILFNLLKICLIRREYNVVIKNYTIDLTPQKLGVIYEREGTYIEISNDDYYEETERNTEVRYFVIDNHVKESYEASITKAIRTEGLVLNTNGHCEEIYEVSLWSQFETDNISNYVKPDPDHVTIQTDLIATIRKEIHRDDKRTDTLDLLLGTNIIPVIYYEKENIFVPTREQRKTYDPDNYHELIPDNSEVTKIAKMIYACMIDYYTNYMKENS